MGVRRFHILPAHLSVIKIFGTGQQEEAVKTAQEVMQIDPTFSIAKYVENQPYKDEMTVKRLVESLRKAGLPE